MRLQDFVDMAEATKKVGSLALPPASQDGERVRVRPLPLYTSTGTDRAEHLLLQQSVEHGPAGKGSALASTLPLGSTLSKHRDTRSPVKSHTKNHSAAEASPEALLQSAIKQPRFAGPDPGQPLPQYQVGAQRSEYDPLPPHHYHHA